MSLSTFPSVCCLVSCSSSCIITISPCMLSDPLTLPEKKLFWIYHP
jgi:hypothetical protein